MAGVKGSGGPVPKRDDKRRRRNAKPQETDHAAGADEVAIPKANSKWHPVAKRWFNSLAASGQSRYYEPSDWATAYLLAETISRELKPQPMTVGRGEDATIQMVYLPPKSASIAAWLKGMTSLLATEGDRRRAALELERPGPGDGEAGGDVAWIDDARNRLRGAG